MEGEEGTLSWYFLFTDLYAALVGIQIISQKCDQEKVFMHVSI